MASEVSRLTAKVESPMSPVCPTTATAPRAMTNSKPTVTSNKITVMIER